MAMGWYGIYGSRVCIERQCYTYHFSKHDKLSLLAGTGSGYADGNPFAKKAR